VANDVSEFCDEVGTQRGAFPTLRRTHPLFSSTPTQSILPKYTVDRLSATAGWPRAPNATLLAPSQETSEAMAVGCVQQGTAECWLQGRSGVGIPTRRGIWPSQRFLLMLDSARMYTGKAA
jgi:hypothetical protein